MKLAIPFPSVCRAAAVALTVCLLGVPAAARAASVTNETGVRLLEAELLPTKTTLLKAGCDQLVIAVSKTTLVHPRDAVSILDAALTRRLHKLDEKFATLPCACARRIFLASLAAAPRRSSDILDLAMELYPDCTPEFADALRAFDSRSQSGQPGENSPESPGTNRPLGGYTGNLLDADSDGGFGVGFGPGFPGSPGFTGSGPSGGLALPPTPTTSVVNG